jgi:PRTRC genetic system protein A
MSKVGYRYFTEQGLMGEPGLYYDYMVGANGVFIRAENRFISATISVADAHIRGLKPVDTRVVLKYGKIPWRIYHLAISTLMIDTLHEHYLAVVWQDGSYHLQMPPQESGESWVKFESLPERVMEFHSHGLMRAFFSMTDYNDEQSLAIYAVVGKLDQLIPETEVRVGVYGYYEKLSLNEVFGDV